jgi:CheY-like chemotaxis protein
MVLTGMDERVLLSVEDSDPDFYVIQLALKEAGIAIQVCRVEDGEQALLFLERSGKFAGAPKPHIVLLNVNMPRKNGLEVLEYIKSNDSFRSIPVIMFTTSADARERKRALALGAEEFITKDSNFDALVEDLSRVCARFLKGAHGRSAEA